MSLFDLRVIIGLMILMASVFAIGHRKGYEDKEREDAIVIQAKNQEMNEAKGKADEQLSQAQKQLADKQNQLLNAVHSGDKRLYVAISSKAGSSTVGDGKERAELDRSVSESLIAITNEGDQAIIQLNSCIDQYEAMREIIRGKR